MILSIEQIAEIAKQTLLYIQKNGQPLNIHVNGLDMKREIGIDLIFEQYDHEDIYDIDLHGNSTYRRSENAD